MSDDHKDPTWSADAVATLVEKTAGFVSALIRRAKTPDKVLRRITDLTQTLRDAETVIDRRVDDLFADTPTPTDPTRGDDQ